MQQLRPKLQSVLALWKPHECDVQMIIAGTDTSSVTMFYLLKACQGDGNLENTMAAEVHAATGDCTYGLDMCLVPAYTADGPY